MAIISPNSLLSNVHGSIGKLTVVHLNGRIILRQKPSAKPAATPKRKAHRGKMGRASQWASCVLADPETAAVYEAAAQGSGLSAHNIAVSDFMNDPVIEDIDLSAYSGQSGQTIRVQAKDGDKVPPGVGLASLKVAIRSLAGAILEEGLATGQGQAWNYLTQQQMPPGVIVKIEVTATDRPGNHAAKIIPHLTAE